MKCKDCPFVKIEKFEKTWLIYGFCHHELLSEPRLIGRDLDVDTVWFCPIRKEDENSRSASSVG